MPQPTFPSEAQIRESIAGEEDPGASLDLVRSMFRKGQRKAAQQAGVRSIHMDYTQGTDVIGVDVGWPPPTAGSGGREKSTAELLGLVVAYHGQIANTAWSCFHHTGRRQVALEVGEDADGVFYVNLQDA